MLVRRGRGTVQDQGGLHSWDRMPRTCSIQDRHDNISLLSDVEPYTHLRADMQAERIHQIVPVSVFMLLQQRVQKERQAWRATVLYT